MFTRRATCSSRSAVYQKCQPIKGDRKAVARSRDWLSSRGGARRWRPSWDWAKGPPCARDWEPAGVAMAAPGRDGQGHRPLGCSPAVPGAVPGARSCARCPGLSPVPRAVPGAPRASSLDAQPPVPSGAFRVAAGPLVASKERSSWGRPPPGGGHTHSRHPSAQGAPQAGAANRGWAPGPETGGPADTACAPASGEGAWFLLHENKGVARYSFFYPIQRKNKNYDVYRSLNF